MDTTAELAREFERESHRIDQLIWDAMTLRAGESALFCGSTNNADWIKRAVEIGVDVSVIANESDGFDDLHGVPIKFIRGSTSLLPARDAAYDAAIAFHYLHEIDPFFHSNVVSELARCAKRLVIVEPAPPSDPLGLRIAALYSRAKRELGQFENYHPIDYWRKLVSIVKSDVTHASFSFMRTPPRFAIRETVSLIIAMMAAQDTPESYLEELRMLAKRPDAQLVPQARYVVVGAAVGQIPAVGAGTDFRERHPDEARRVIVSPFPAAPAAGALLSGAVPPRVYNRADTESEFPNPTPHQAPAAATNPAKIARNAFGLPVGNERPQPGVAPSMRGEDTGETFGPPTDPADAAAEFGWEWETPAKS